MWYVWRVRFWLSIPEMNTLRKAMEWLICFSIINVMLGYLLFKKLKKFDEFCSLWKAVRMPSTYLGVVHGYFIHQNFNDKMSLWFSKKRHFFKFFLSDVFIRIMIENEICCYTNGFLKWDFNKKTSYIVGNKKLCGKICILNFRNKVKSIFASI